MKQPCWVKTNSLFFHRRSYLDVSHTNDRWFLRISRKGLWSLALLKMSLISSSLSVCSVVIRGQRCPSVYVTQTWPRDAPLPNNLHFACHKNWEVWKIQASECTDLPMLTFSYRTKVSGYPDMGASFDTSLPANATGNRKIPIKSSIQRPQQKKIE